VRCAECGRRVERKPVYLGRVVFGESCALRLGILKPRARRYAVATPRPIAEPAPEALDGEIPLWTDEEGIET